MLSLMLLLLRVRMLVLVLVLVLVIVIVIVIAPAPKPKARSLLTPPLPQTLRFANSNRHTATTRAKKVEPHNHRTPIWEGERPREPS